MKKGIIKSKEWRGKAKIKKSKLRLKNHGEPINKFVIRFYFHSRELHFQLGQLA